MKAEVKEKLVEALLSGEFRQTRNVLRRKDALCVGGVLCELYRRETGEGGWVSSGSFSMPGGGLYRAYVPQKVIDWAGVEAEKLGVVIGWNDTGDSFETIAHRLRVMDADAL